MERSVFFKNTTQFFNGKINAKKYSNNNIPVGTAYTIQSGLSAIETVRSNG
ncbi:hypothetical protein [Arenibacter sp. H213]|uniref:Uncharacterized protein n=1 Tax=Arenibacter antarcticus TaxID=2040469 RepID=A0ABW5VDU4_9FLAO|nr:hypothetical protein [Arenibacter sp. H213]